MKSSSIHSPYRRRRIVNTLMLALSMAATILGIFFLAWILWTTFNRGLNALTLDLFTKMKPPPPGTDGGLLDAFFGSFLICSLSLIIGTPIGIAAGTFLAEYARKSWLGETIRFVNDILLSAPSIVLGLFVYTLVVRNMGHFSGFAGAIALALILLPVVVRTTDEMLKLVPNQMREAALSLGIPQWKVTVQILYRAARPGIVTGILLGLARISGETAPLLFTAFGNDFWSTNVMQPLSSVPAVLFNFAMSPYDGWNALAWAGALVMTTFVLLVSLIARVIILRKKVQND